MSTFIGQFDFEIVDIGFFDPLYFMLCWYDEDLISFERLPPPRPSSSRTSAGRDGLDAYQRWLADFNAQLAEAEHARLALQRSDGLPGPLIDEALAELRALMLLAHPDKWQGSEATATEFTARLSALRDRLDAARGLGGGSSMADAIGNAGTPQPLGGRGQYALPGRGGTGGPSLLQVAVAGGAFAMVLALGPIGGLLALAGGVLALLLSSGKKDPPELLPGDSSNDRGA